MSYSNHTVAGTIVYDLTDGDYPLSDNFRLSEFRCKAKKPKNNIILVHSQLIQLLEAIRREAGQRYGEEVSVRINSAYRTESYNKEIGGSAHSQHTKGMAADIVLLRKDGTTIPTNEVAEIAELFNPGGLGRYRTFIHVDVFGKNRRWYG